MGGMTHMTPTHPDALADVRPVPNVAPVFGLDVLRADAQCHVGPVEVAAPADRIGLHLDAAGSAWVTIEHPTAAGHPFTMLGLDDPEGRRQALALLPWCAEALAVGDAIGAAMFTVEHRGAAGGRVLDPAMADHLTIVAARYLDRDGIEVQP